MFAKQRDQAGERFKTQEGAAWVLWLLTAARTLSYFLERGTVLSHLVDRMGQDWVSPTMWGTAWLLLTLAIVSQRREVLIVSMGVSMGIVFLWGTLYLWSDPAQFLSRGSVFLALCGAIAWGTVRPIKTPKEDGDAAGSPADD